MRDRHGRGLGVRSAKQIEAGLYKLQQHTDCVYCTLTFYTYFIASGTIRSSCDTIRDLTDLGLRWPDLSNIHDGIQDVVDVLDPILDFFTALQDALNTELCITNPFEALAEWEVLECVLLLPCVLNKAAN